MEEMLFRNICVGGFLAISAAGDLKNRRICVPLVAVFGILGILMLIIQEGSPPLDAFGGAVIGAMIIGISQATKGAVGMGDGLVLAVTGIHLGFAENLELLAGGLLLAFCYSVFLLTVKKAWRKKELPFIPFLFLAFVGMALDG